MIPGSGRSPEEGNGYPLQCSLLENPMDRGAWRAKVHGAAKSCTRLSNERFHFHQSFQLHLTVSLRATPGAGVVGGCPVPPAQSPPLRGPTLGLALCCCHLEILNTFSAKGPAFSCCLGPTNYVAYPNTALLRERQEERLENQLPLSAAFSQAGSEPRPPLPTTPEQLGITGCMA